jgi:predicted nucleotidyltransferase component of viral defense system
LDTRDYGHHLKISFVSREGQILLKTYAILNRAKTRDLEDLNSLLPNSSEIEIAVRWVLSNIATLSHRDKLPELLTHLGHAQLISIFQG